MLEDAAWLAVGFPGTEIGVALGVVVDGVDVIAVDRENVAGRWAHVLYHPSLARFLQADTYVQFPNVLQNHNRYSYVMNNLLAYADSSGHFIFTLSALACTATPRY